MRYDSLGLVPLLLLLPLLLILILHLKVSSLFSHRVGSNIDHGRFGLLSVCTTIINRGLNHLFSHECIDIDHL